MKWRDDFIFFLFLTLPHLKHISQKSRSWRLNILVDQISLLIYSNVNLHAKWKKLLVFQSYLTLCDPMDVAHQAPLSMGFSRQEYWSGLLFPTPGESSWLSDRTHFSYVPCIGRQLLYHVSSGKSSQVKIITTEMWGSVNKGWSSWLRNVECGDSSGGLLQPEVQKRWKGIPQWFF